ncbi:MAG: TonB-dependent receptor, partial [Proteobacteria bacterium]|nr:TonB-dependent receptor [Pseudomonadota bacterium]
TGDAGVVEGGEGEVDLTEIDLPEGGGFMAEAYGRIVVTASRYGQDPLDSPSTTTVLTADDIRLSGVTNLPDLLRRVVGVDVMSLAAAHTDVSIRGFNRELNNKVLVLIDGRSTYWDFIGSSFWTGFPVSLEEIERIEVIRGPGSAVYGANAVTGVINIITKTPGENAGTKVRLDAGIPGVMRGNIVSTGRSGPTSYRFSGGFERHARWSKDYDLDEDSPLVPFAENQDQAMQVIHAMGRLDRTFGEKGFGSISAGYSTGSFEFYNIGALGNYGIDYTSHFVRGDIAYGPVHLRSFWNSDAGNIGTWLEAKDAARTLDGEVDNDAVDVEVEVPAEFSTGPIDHRFNIGVGYRYKHIRFTYLEGGFDNIFNEHHLKAFVNEEAGIGIFKVVGSLRVDRHPLIANIGRTISPRGALIVRVAPNTAVRVTGGTAYRAPNSVESYMDFNLPSSSDGAYIQDIGDDVNLLPERIGTIEAGVHDESTAYHTADLALYLNHVSDLITLDSVSPELGFFDANENGFKAGQTGWINSDPKYTGYGVEAEVETFPIDGLDIYGNLNVMSVSENTDDGTTRDTQNSLVKVNIGAMYRTPFWTDVTFDVHYVGPQTWRLREFDVDGQLQLNPQDVPARVLLSARIAVRPIPDDKFEIAATFWNITAFKHRHQEHPKGQLVGPRAFGTLTYEF